MTIKPQKLEKDNQIDYLTKYARIIGLLISLFILAGYLLKPILWPARLQSEIIEIKKEIIQKDTDIRKDMNNAIEKVKDKFASDQALIKNDLDHLKQKVDKMENMVEFLYLKGGGKK